MEDIKANPYKSLNIRRGIRHFVVGRAVAGLLGFIVTMMLVRVLPVTEYAAFVTVVGLQTFISLLSSMGLERVAARYVPGVRVNARSGALASFTITLLALRLFSLAFAIALINLFSEQLVSVIKLSQYQEYMGLIWLLAGIFALVQFLIVICQSMMLQKVVQQALLIQWAGRLLAIVGFILISANLDLIDVVIVFITTAVMALIYMLFCVVRHLQQLAEDKAWDRSEWMWLEKRRQLANLGWQNYLQTIFVLPSNHGSRRLMAASLFIPLDIAAFGLMQTIAEFVKRYSPAQLMQGIAEPVIAAKYSETGDRSQLIDMTNVILKFSLFLLTPFIAWIFIAGEPLVLFITGGKYGGYSWLLGILLLIVALENQWLVMQNYANTLERSEILVYSSVLSSVLALALFIPLFYLSVTDLKIFALGLLGVVLIRNLYGINRFRKHDIALTMDIGAYSKIFAAAAMVALFVLGMNKIFVSNTNIWLAVVDGIFLFLGFLVITRILKPFSISEKRIMERLFPRVKMLW